MAFDDETADILGGPILQNKSVGFFSKWATLSLSFKATLVLGLGFLAWLLLIHARDTVFKWQEYSYKKAMRRRHGIPDNDNRPFTVAYAAATRARAEREAQGKSKEKQIPDQLPAWTQRNALADGLRLRQRFANAAPAQNVASSASIQGTTHQSREDRSGPTYTQQRADRDPLNFADRYDPNPRRIQEHVTEHDDESAPPRTKVSSRRVSRKTLHFNGNAPSEETKKRSWDNESEFEPESAKKSRVEGDELIDGDEDAGWFEQRDKSRQLARGSKRSYGSEVDEDNYPRVNGRDKRSRKASQDKSSEDQDDLMETDDVEEDELTELRSIPRGKKRDRTEAGSTFGGDDEDEVTAAPDDKALRHHKRRTVSKRKSEAALRGSKRNRDTDAVDSEGEGSPGSHKHKERSSRKKRGKKAASEETQSDISMDSSMSKDPLCKGRKIGEEWEASGVQYKVGNSGERLRLTLVKKARSKFPMPKDSQHPDRSANLEIYVETWMTEEQHKLAEDRHELVWQDTPRVSVEPQTPGDVPDSPSKTGKNLLWESTKDSPIARRPFRQSIATNVGIRINPFQQSQNIPGRRVASSYNLPTPALFGGVGDSPTRRSSRFSKWEKQDLEAEAMAKMRAKVQEQKKLSGPQKKAGELPTSVTAPELGAKATVTTPLFTAPAPTPVNNISFAKPAEKPAQASENKAATSTPFSFGTTSNTTDISKQTSGHNIVTSGLPTPSSTLPGSTSTGADEKPKWSLFPPATEKPTVASSQPAGPSSSSFVPSFSFAPPPKQSESSPNLASTSAASSVPASTSIPNFFSSKPAATSQPEAPQKSFAPFSTGAAGLGASTAPSFAGFGVSNSEQKKAAEASSTGGSSLTARLGGFAPQVAADSSKPTAAPTSSPFSFGKATAPTLTTSTITGQQADKPPSAFGNNTSTPSIAFNSAPVASSTTKTDDPAPMKFDFGVKAKPVGSTPKPPMTAPNSMSAFPSTISANTASEGMKPAASTSAPSFSFASPTPANAAASSSGLSGSTEPPKFGFGQPSAGTGSVFGPTGSSSMTSSTTPKSAFGGFGSDATSKSSPFGASAANTGANQSAMSSTPTSIFGAANTANDDSRKSAAASTAPPVFGGFGGNNASTSAFGATSTPTTTSNSNAMPSSMPKTAFSGFGSGATSTSAFSTTPAGSPASMKPFAFGNPSASLSGGNQPAEESKASPFAPSATKTSSSPFAFGASGTSGFGGSNASSAPMSSAVGGASKPAGGGFTFGGSGFGQPPSGAPSSSSTASQSVFGKPSQPTPSSFGFGKPSGGSTFAFGQPSASGQNQQQKQ